MLFGTLLGTQGCASPPPELPKVVGTMADLEEYLQKLLDAEAPDAFLIVEEAETPDHFLQFTVASDAIEMDMPLITHGQQAREQRMWQFCEERALAPRINPGEGGARFLDCYLPRAAGQAGALVMEAFQVVFGTPTEAAVQFSAYGIPEVAP